MALNVAYLPSFTFKTPTTIILSGSTGSGKTTLLRKILETPSLFSSPPERIIYCYSVYQEQFANLKNVEFRNGIDIPELDSDKHTVIVFDDLMHEIVKSKFAEYLFLAGSHHRNITIFLIMQNLYQKGRFAKNIMLNTHYNIVMNNARDIYQIKCLGRQTGLGKDLEEAYNDCMKEQYGYLLIDLSPHVSDRCHFKLKTNIFPNEMTVAYLSENEERRL